MRLARDVAEIVPPEPRHVAHRDEVIALPELAARWIPGVIDRIAQIDGRIDQRLIGNRWTAALLRELAYDRGKIAAGTVTNHRKPVPVAADVRRVRRCPFERRVRILCSRRRLVLGRSEEHTS